MFRLTRLADYAILLLTYFARDPGRIPRSAREVARLTRLPQPTVSKILKLLAHRGFLSTRRGARGGFTLARPPKEVTVAEVVMALEGPISITVCGAHVRKCGLERVCFVRENWRKINVAVLDALQKITLEEMSRPIVRLAPPSTPHPETLSRKALGGAP